MGIYYYTLWYQNGLHKWKGKHFYSCLPHIGGTGLYFLKVAFAGEYVILCPGSSILGHLS
jgi:hypothetical protein